MKLRVYLSVSLLTLDTIDIKLHCHRSAGVDRHTNVYMKTILRNQVCTHSQPAASCGCVSGLKIIKQYNKTLSNVLGCLFTFTCNNHENMDTQSLNAKYT